MLLRTHLAFGILMIILFISHVNSPFIFILAVIIGTVIPDLDNGFSAWGRHLIFRPLQFFVKHRGIIHSFTTAVLLSVALTFLWPAASLGFFIGYSVHLICDSFTKEGIQPFWPLKAKSKGPIKTGGRIEETLFLFMILINVLLIVLWVVF